MIHTFTPTKIYKIAGVPPDLALQSERSIH